MSRKFDGTDDMINCTQVDPFNAASRLTAMAWIKQDSQVGGDRIVNYWGATLDVDTSWIFSIAAGAAGADELISGVNDCVTNLARISTSLNANLVVSKWNHVCMSWNSGGNLDIYSNFLRLSTASNIVENPASSQVQSLTNLLIGKGNTVGDTFTGSIKDVQLFKNVALTKNEIFQSAYYPGSIRRGIRCEYPLWGDAVVEPDIGNANSVIPALHGVVTGTTYNKDNPPTNGYGVIKSPGMFSSF